jgi:hypothetical protein
MEGDFGENTIINTEELIDIKKALRYYRTQYKKLKDEVVRLTLRIHNLEDSSEVKE